MTEALDLFSVEQSRDFAEILKAVAHPLRLRIIDHLEKGELCVGDLARRVEKKQAIVSQQLKILRMVGLVKTERRLGRSYYRINNRVLNDLLTCLRRCTGADDDGPGGDEKEGN